MKTTKKIFLIILFSLLLISCSKSTEPIELPIIENTDHDNSIYVQQLNKVITELNGSSPTLDNSDLQPFAEYGNSKIVALGEATHGTKEFFEIKHRLLKYFVEEHGFKVFGIEADMGESYYINKYVLQGEGNLEDLMKNKMHFWTWRTQEVKAMIEWMKNYNTGKSENEKIYYIGFDNQFLSYQPQLIVEFYEKYKPTFTNTVKEKLGDLYTLNLRNYNVTSDYFGNMSISERDELLNNLEDLVQNIDSLKSELLSQSSEYEYNITKQLIRNAQQAIQVIFNNNNGGSNENLRDKYMSENSVWLSELFGSSTKAVLWAHNMHIANFPQYGGGGSMGHRLRFLFDDYRIIGFSFSKGKFSAVNQSSGFGTQIITESPNNGSSNYIFYNAQYDNFILKFKNINNGTELYEWLNSRKPFLSIGAVYNGAPLVYYTSINLNDMFDVIINYDATNYAVQLD